MEANSNTESRNIEILSLMGLYANLMPVKPG